MSYKKMLKASAIVNGRLVMVETVDRCYYRYWIFPTEEPNYHPYAKDIIKSSFTFTTWKSALESGKKIAAALTALNKD